MPRYRPSRWPVRKEGSNLVALELLAQHGIAALVDPVNLEHVFVQIKADRRNVCDRRSTETGAPLVDTAQARPLRNVQSKPFICKAAEVDTESKTDEAHIRHKKAAMRPDQKGTSTNCAVRSFDFHQKQLLRPMRRAVPLARSV